MNTIQTMPAERDRIPYDETLILLEQFRAYATTNVALSTAKNVNNAIDMIRHLPNMDYVIPAAIGHHERWDGKGYPRRLSGTDIPISARCLAIADAYDAMTTDRPYRRGLSPEYAAQQIEQNAGIQFDPQLAMIFVSLIRSGELSHVGSR